MIGDIIRKCLRLREYEACPKCGIFYAIDGKLVTRDFCQWAVDADAGQVFPAFDGFRLEHRDMWDEVIAAEYPVDARRYGDDHKAMPRGRVELISCPGEDLQFRVTLCPCLDTSDFRAQVCEAFRLPEGSVEWSFGTMNYVCRDCSDGGHSSRAGLS